MTFKPKNQATPTPIALMGLTRFGAGGLAIGMGLGVALGAALGRRLPNK